MPSGGAPGCRVLEVEAAYVEEVHCVALHPSATLLAAGFQDKLRLMTVLVDELKRAPPPRPASAPARRWPDTPPNAACVEGRVRQHGTAGLTARMRAGRRHRLL